jgi:positive regulator of sigma E activity
MTADAVVVAARADGSLDLEFQVRACAACAGTCLWRRLKSTRIEGLRAEQKLAPGAAVTVLLPERRVLLASVLLHGVPLVAILVGAALGAALTASDGGTLLGAAIGLGVAIAAFGRLGRRLERATLARLKIVPRL